MSMSGPDSAGRQDRILYAWLLLSVVAAAINPAAVMAESLSGWQQGEWEITARTVVSHAAYAMPPEHYNRCISRENMNPAEDLPGGECRLIDEQISGSVYRWNMHCLAEGKAMNVHGEAVYEGAAMQGSVRLVSDTMTRVTHIIGKYIGPCR